MKYGKLMITRGDYDIILDLFNRVKPKDVVHQACYTKLQHELGEANIVDDTELPDDVVRLFSWMDVETPFGRLDDYQIVMPSRDNRSSRKISILSPMGTALIGYATGDEVIWNFPAGEKTIQILNVRQYAKSVTE